MMLSLKWLCRTRLLLATLHRLMFSWRECRAGVTLVGASGGLRMTVIEAQVLLLEILTLVCSRPMFEARSYRLA